MTISTTTDRVKITRRGYGGVAAIAGASLAIAGNTALLFVPVRVGSEIVSYPLTPGAFRWGQVFFAVTQALMAYGIFELVRPRVGVPRRRSTAVFATLAVVGFVITVPGELALIAVARDTMDSGAVNVASTVFGLGLLVADVGLIGYGLTTVRRTALPIILGAFQLLVVTPVAVSAGFSSIAAFVVIAVADLLVAIIGIHLLTAE